MMKKTILAMGLLCASVAAHAAPTCTGLVGTWQADIYDGPNNHAVEKFVIQKGAGTDGRLVGKTESGNYMAGFCTNGVIYLYEAFTSEKFANSYYFANKKNGFGQNINTWADPSFSFPIEVMSWQAVIKKVSPSTTLNASHENYYIKKDIDFRVLQIMDKINQQ